MTQFVVPGPPVAKGRPRFSRGRTFTPPRTVAYEAKVRAAARRARVPLLAGPVVLEVDFYLATARRVDLDNLVKGVADAINGAAYLDDAQVVRIVATKQVDRKDPRAVVRVTRAE